jgi:hypothetical protein
MHKNRNSSVRFVLLTFRHTYGNRLTNSVVQIFVQQVTSRTLGHYLLCVCNTQQNLLDFAIISFAYTIWQFWSPSVDAGCHHPRKTCKKIILDNVRSTLQVGIGFDSDLLCQQ